VAYIASTVFELFMVLCYGFGAERLHIDYMVCGMLGMWFCRHSCGRNLYEFKVLRWTSVGARSPVPSTTIRWSFQLLFSPKILAYCARARQPFSYCGRDLDISRHMHRRRYIAFNHSCQRRELPVA